MLKISVVLLGIIPLILGQETTVFPPNRCDGVENFAYVASHNDCRLYYQCINGVAFQLQCPRGNYFSTERQTCVAYSESDCPLLTPPPPVLPTCSDVPEFGYIPSMEACDYYYQCFSGQQWLLKCPRGLYFSFEQQTCVRPNESDCPLLSTTPSPSPTPPTPPALPTCNDVPEFGYIPSMEACDYYYQCFLGQQWLLKCPRGLYFSFEQQTCVRPVDSDCPLLSTTPSPPPPPPTPPPPPVFPTCDDVPDFGYIPSRETCAQFYQCFLGQQWLMQCPRGNYFSFERQTCVSYGESDCLLLNTPPTPPFPPPTPPQTGPPPPPPTPPQTGPPPPPPTPPQTAPPLPPPNDDLCEDENCYQSVERVPEGKLIN